MNKKEDTKDNEPLSPKPDKAYKDLRFLTSSDARPIRVLCELTEPGYRLARMGVKNSIVFFGSARNPAPERMEALLKDIEKNRSDSTLSEGVTEQLKVRQRQIERAAKYYGIARELSQRLTTWSDAQTDPRRQFYVCSGGGPGIMEAANRGARDAGGQSIAFGISLPFEQKLNPYCTEELSFDFHYFFLRKYWFLYHAKALVVFPGGYGTLDELFETLTLVQTQKTTKRIRVLLVGREFWDTTINFSNLVEWGVISPEDLGLFHMTDSVDEAFEILTTDFIEGKIHSHNERGSN